MKILIEIRGGCMVNCMADGEPVEVVIVDHDWDDCLGVSREQAVMVGDVDKEVERLEAEYENGELV